MSWAERAKSAAGTALIQVVGRRTLARTARFLTNVARLDATNDMLCNGETLVQETVIAHTVPGTKLVAADVGAHTGQWTNQLLARARGRDLAVHAFEPDSSTAALFRQNVTDGGVTLNVEALSDKPGTAEISVYAAGMGINALVPDSALPASYREPVRLTTFDDYCRERSLDEVSLMKIDAEGHDLFVLRGAASMFAGQKIAVAQFEYNHRWIWSRVFLRDVFEFAGQCGYRLGKVTQRGIEFYAAWDKELEKFQEGNYVLCRADWVSHFPRIRWWAEDRSS